MGVMSVVAAPTVSEHDEKKTEELKVKMQEMIKSYGVCTHR